MAVGKLSGALYGLQAPGQTNENCKLSNFSLRSSATSISYLQTANPSLDVADRATRKPNDIRHLVPVRTCGERPPLFCIFPGPPGSTEFVEFLPDDQPSYDFYFTKLDGAASFPKVEQLAQMFLSEIREIQPHGPYQLCGYSKAGLVAYEIARLLLIEGESVPLLALFETWHPGFEENLTGVELIQFRILHIADRLHKYGRDLFRGRFLAAADVVWKGISRRMRKLSWRLARQFFRTSGQPVPKGMQQVEAIVVLKSFVPKPYSNRLMLIRTDDPFEKRLKDQTLGWRRCVAEGIDVHFVPGGQDHGTLMDKPHVQYVIEKIRPYLAGHSKL